MEGQDEAAGGAGDAAVSGSEDGPYEWGPFLTARIGAMLLLRHHLDLWREHGKQGANGAAGNTAGNSSADASANVNAPGGAHAYAASSNVVVPDLSLIELVREVR